MTFVVRAARTHCVATLHRYLSRTLITKACLFTLAEPNATDCGTSIIIRTLPLSCEECTPSVATRDSVHFLCEFQILTGFMMIIMFHRAKFI